MGIKCTKYITTPNTAPNTAPNTSPNRAPNTAPNMCLTHLDPTIWIYIITDLDLYNCIIVLRFAQLWCLSDSLVCSSVALQVPSGAVGCHGDYSYHCSLSNLRPATLHPLQMIHRHIYIYIYIHVYIYIYIYIYK